MNLTYDWAAGLTTVLLVIAVVVVGQFLVFRIPAIATTRQQNNEANKQKLKTKGDKYRHRIKTSQNIALAINVVFYAGILPFLVTLSPQPLSKIALDVVLILMIYDFFYYLVHRFAFHGNGYLRKVHAVHHQARSRVSSVDSLMLHPWEIFIGIALFYAVISAIALIAGEPFQVATIVICNVIYTQLNQINHCKIDLHTFPWRTLNWIAIRHDAHHLDMHKGNYATITLLYDRLFGTLETHPSESAVREGNAT